MNKLQVGFFYSMNSVGNGKLKQFIMETLMPNAAIELWHALEYVISDMYEP